MAVGPFRAIIGPRGPAVTTRIPGTGLSFSHALGSSPRQSPADRQVSLARQPAPFTPELSPPEMNGIKSAGSGALTTPGLNEFKRLLEQACREHGAIVQELIQARTAESTNVGRYTRWKTGWLMRRLFKEKFEQLRVVAEESSAKRAELEEQEQLSRLQTKIDLPDGVAKAFHQMNDEFAILAKSQRIWDTVGQRNTNRIVERTTATRAVERKPVTFKLGRCELIESEWKVPHLENANGGDIFFYPAFALYFISPDNFALLEYKDIQLEFSPSRFIEEETIPGDAEVVGHTWAKANKDGSPDKRFKGNYQIPIAQYGKLTITSATGMKEEYMVSNTECAQVFSSAWKRHAIAITVGV